MGHVLGLPDYYDYNTTIGPQGGVGGFDMMDGNWLDHNTFSKYMLDWTTPIVIGSNPMILPAPSTQPETTSLRQCPDHARCNAEQLQRVLPYRKPGPRVRK